MRPPILVVASGFGAGLWVGLVAFSGSGSARLEFLGLMGAALPLLGAMRWAGRAPLLAGLTVAGVAGFLWGGAAARERRVECAGVWGERRGGGSHAVTVRLMDPADGGGALVDGAVRDGPCRGSVPLRWPRDSAAAGGTTWLVAGRWVQSADRGVLVVRTARLLDGERRGRGGIRDRIAARSAVLFGNRAPLVDALVFARRGDLDPAVRERYAQAGLAHLLVIAGLHVGFLVGWLMVLLRRMRLRPITRFVVACVLVFAYLWLLGFPAPATRAGVMLAMAGVARLRQRVVAPRGTIALAAFCLLVVDPWAVWSAGAWLSVAAVGAVIWAGRVTARSSRALRLVAPTIAATLLTAPITAFAFGTVAPVGVLANLIAIPVAAVTVPGLVLALIASVVLHPLAVLLSAGAGAGLALLDLIARVAASVPFGHVTMVAGAGAAALWMGVLLVGWWLWRSPRRPWLIGARALFAVTLCAWGWAFSAVSLDDCRCLTVSFLNVGQGDAAALRTPAGRWIVIDGGPREPGNDAGRRVVVPFLRRHGARGLALMVSTHSDADHLGGLPAVIEAFPPRLVIEPGEPLARPLYLEFLAEVEGSGARWRAARAGDQITVDSVTFQVLSPDEAWMGVPVDVNDHGVVLLVTYGATRILFQADAGLPVEARLAGTVGRVDLLKVGHHGSRSATSDAWLDELAPPTAVISVGARNRYGHPAPEVLERLRRHGIEILRTDQRGTITFTSDGQHVPHDVGHDH
jgi:competence protein ComEC